MDITFELDDELIAAAEAVAVRHGTSISHLVRASLEQLVAVDDGTCGATQEHDDVHHDQKGS